MKSISLKKLILPNLPYPWSCKTVERSSGIHKAQSHIRTVYLYTAPTL